MIVNIRPSTLCYCNREYSVFCTLVAYLKPSHDKDKTRQPQHTTTKDKTKQDNQKTTTSQPQDKTIPRQPQEDKDKMECSVGQDKSVVRPAMLRGLIFIFSDLFQS
jgi:hypothetical protein